MNNASLKRQVSCLLGRHRLQPQTQPHGAEGRGRKQDLLGWDWINIQKKIDKSTVCAEYSVRFSKPVPSLLSAQPEISVSQGPRSSTNTGSQILRLRKDFQWRPQTGCKRRLDVALDQDDIELRHQRPIRRGQSSQCGKSLCRASASRHGSTTSRFGCRAAKLGILGKAVGTRGGWLGARGADRAGHGKLWENWSSGKHDLTREMAKCLEDIANFHRTIR